MCLRENTKILLILTVVALLLFGRQEIALAIDGGCEDSDSNPQHPNACSVIGVDFLGELRMASGVLIHPRVVLTAGHVTDWFVNRWEIPLAQTYVCFAANVADATHWRPVSCLVTHPLYNGYYGAEGHGDLHDLGVLILEEPVDAITPAILPNEGFLDHLREAGALDFGVTHGTQMTVVGYGWGYSFPPPMPLRDDRGARRFGPMTCMGMMKSSLHFLLDPDGVVTMNGDSGGPTFYDDNGTLKLVGIVAWGSPVPGIDHRYRVDTEDSLNFIRLVLDNVDDCSGP